MPKKILLLGLLLGAFVTPSGFAQYDPNPAWPLCGQWWQTETNSAVWAGGCPSTRWGLVDLINDTYGPRLRSGEYDWHRGLDLHTDNADGRPVFAITCGKVKKVEDSYNGEVIVEHYPDHTCTGDEDEASDFTACHRHGSDQGCYYSRYQHLSDVVEPLAVGDIVAKGELLGFTGRNGSSSSSSAYPHLHFEIRDYPGGPDYYARGQREAIHPLRVLPYGDTNLGSVGVSFGTVTPGATTTTAEVDVTMTNDGEELDLVRIEVRVYRDGVEVPWSDPLPTAYPTPDGDNFVVEPHFFDMELWSRQYTYTDTSKIDYSEFLDADDRPSSSADGQWVSPFADTQSAYHQAGFPTSYDADWHLEAKKIDGGVVNVAVGEFNGQEVAPANFNRFSSSYDLAITFEKLPGLAGASTYCLEAWVVDASGNSGASAPATWGTGCP